MSNREPATFELSKGEARVVIAALADEEMTASGERATRLQNVQDRLAAEFEFGQYRGTSRDELAENDHGELTENDRDETAESDDGWFAEEWLGGYGVFDTDDTESIELSHVEADAVTDALAAFELDETHENASVAENIRSRILDAFDGDLVGAGD